MACVSAGLYGCASHTCMVTGRGWQNTWNEVKSGYALSVVGREPRSPAKQQMLFMSESSLKSCFICGLKGAKLILL